MFQIREEMVEFTGGNSTDVLTKEEAEKLLFDIGETVRLSVFDKYFKDAVYYINTETGSTGTYDDWYYTDIDGNTVNAVDLNEVEAI